MCRIFTSRWQVYVLSTWEVGSPSSFNHQKLARRTGFICLLWPVAVQKRLFPAAAQVPGIGSSGCGQWLQRLGDWKLYDLACNKVLTWKCITVWAQTEQDLGPGPRARTALSFRYALLRPSESLDVERPSACQLG